MTGGGGGDGEGLKKMRDVREGEVTGRGFQGCKRGVIGRRGEVDRKGLEG